MTTAKNIKFIRWETIEPTTLRPNSSWILPQVTAALGSGLPLAINANGKISFEETFNSWRDGNFGSSGIKSVGELRGICNYLNYKTRGEIMKETQTKAGLPFNAGVPLVLASFKKYRNVNYEDWDWTEWEGEKPPVWRGVFLDPTLQEFISYRNSDFELSTEELKELLQVWIDNKQKPAVQLYHTIRTDNKKFDPLPRMVRFALLQTWVYHPSLRHKYMICDFDNFDAMPEPLEPSYLDNPWGVAVKPAEERDPWESPKIKAVVEPEVDIWSLT